MAAKPEQPKPPDAREYLSWGLTLLNLACYGRTSWGLRKGRVYRLAGASSSGKTFLARMVLAEAARNPFFKDHALVYGDEEGGALMDTERYFGKALAGRMEDVKSLTIDGFYDNLLTRLEKGRPVVWVEDSMDALLPVAESKMGDGKAKYNAQNLRKVMDPLEATGSILIMVSQAHVDLKAQIPMEVASGGRALEFYSTLDVWLKKGPAVKKSYKGKEYNVGSTVRMRVMKNRLSGLDRTVYVPFSPSYGFDDVRANIDYLIGVSGVSGWKKNQAGTLTAAEFNYEGPVDPLIDKIEEEGREGELAKLVMRVWKEIEVNLFKERKPKYQ